MRATRASAAVERLKLRTGNVHYSLGCTVDERFYLVLNSTTVPSAPLSDMLTLDDFVKFTDSFGPQKPKRISKLDSAFEKQLTRKVTG